MSSNPFEPGTRRSAALADAAERLGRVASSVKDQQLERTRSGQRPPESEAYVASPEEAWSKKYMIQCVGPVCTIKPTTEGALLLPRFQPLPDAKAPVAGVAVTAGAPASIAARMPVVAPAPKPKSRRGAKAQAEPIGILIGKPVRKRSLLGRMFGS
ncbi:MAG: hypothetical protein JO261_12975 [Alphaproteobacteria bacterium]|nr:hypothetical protein [Alphaproteobacteria bacterium]MBV9694605.1 hypothetical protein [Alphaproteobacteria bacterium]